mgnify:CR=1 FL=1
MTTYSNMKQRTPGNIIASRRWSPRTYFYVESVPGDGGCDWGYTTDSSKALLLNKYFARRFAADCKRVGAKANLLEV